MLLTQRRSPRDGQKSKSCLLLDPDSRDERVQMRADRTVCSGPDCANRLRTVLR